MPGVDWIAHDVARRRYENGPPLVLENDDWQRLAVGLEDAIDEAARRYRIFDSEDEAALGKDELIAWRLSEWRGIHTFPKGDLRQWYGCYLKSEAWQDKRRLVMERCGGICEDCGYLLATQVHHLTYRRVGAERSADLQGLCRRCHLAAHER
jgi:hypothetical protein